MSNQKQIFLHIGYHKTASTTIQFLLNQNREILKSYGYLYPSTGLFVYGHHNIAWEILQSDLFSKDAGNLDRLLEEIHTSNTEKVILSSEDFVPANHLARKNIYCLCQQVFANFTTPPQ